MPQLDPLLDGLPSSEGQSAVDFQLDQFQQGVSSFSPWGIRQGGTNLLVTPHLAMEVRHPL